MNYRVTFAPEAGDDYDDLPAFLKAEVRDAIKQHLRFRPTRESKSRIKRLRGLDRPQYRLRVGEVRVFYDVIDGEVIVLGIIEKSNSAIWLKKWSE
ncbi:MAG: type II toxin-antitoxin system RelE/ParE family toxin [Candidatus Aureabacteria bacterium]|nr:type II toxin-antitoxin system RelE/ParE family toxin [Candidatus Auribacterota bacterium]